MLDLEVVAKEIAEGWRETQYMYVNYGVDALGYTVHIVDGIDVIYEYNAGNCQLDSTVVVRPGTLDAADVATLEHMAARTASEILDELGAPNVPIYRADSIRAVEAV